MKLQSNIILILVNFILITSALPSKIFYYTGARSAPYRNGMMYIRYMQPQYRNLAAGGVAAYSSGDTLATGSFVNPAVDCEDEKHVETFAARVDLNEQKDRTTSIAEAYPPPLPSQENIPVISDNVDDFEEQHAIIENTQSEEQQPTVELEEPEVELDTPQEEPQLEVLSNRKDRTGGGFNHHVNVEHVDDLERFLPTTTIGYAENEITVKNDATTSVPPTIVAPVVPAVPLVPVKPIVVKPNRPKLVPIPPKKKIQVRLDSAAVDDEQEEEQVYTHYNRNPIVPKPVYLPNRGAPPRPSYEPRPVVESSNEYGGGNGAGGVSYAVSQSNNKKKSDQPAQPGQSFFPVYFGGDTGGSAIAIANSYSTGDGGSATSHAIAYGNPSASQLRHKKVHRTSPVKRQ